MLGIGGRAKFPWNDSYYTHDSSNSSDFMCKLYSGSTKMSKAVGTRWETKDLGQSAASGKAHVSHETRKRSNTRKKNRQPISELLERKIGNFRSRLGSCLLRSWTLLGAASRRLWALGTTLQTGFLETKLMSMLTVGEIAC